MNRHYCLAVYLFMVCWSGVAVISAADEHDDKLEKRILDLLMMRDDVTGEYHVELSGYGKRALPVYEKILSTPQADTFGNYRLSRALIYTGWLGDVASALRPHVRMHLMSDSAGIRMRAVPALAGIGGPEDVPILVAMLYDEDSAVRHQTVMALGKLGDASALTALEIWRQQASKADEARPLTEKWIDNAMTKRIEEARSAIQKRLKEKTAS